MKDETNITEIVRAISKKTELDEAAIINLLNFESDISISNFLDILPADLDSVLNGQPNYNVAKRFGLNEADMDNLIVEYGKEFVLGMLVAKLLL